MTQIGAVVLQTVREQLSCGGDVIVSGVVTGQGTIFSGRNAYIPDNVTYANPPSPARPVANSQLKPKTTRESCRR